MNKFCKRLLALLLIFIFSIKTAVPLFASYRSQVKPLTEQKDSDTEDEKDGEKALEQKAKLEIAELFSVEPFTIYCYSFKTVFPAWPLAFLPVQYFAVPTPPPWCNS